MPEHNLVQPILRWYADAARDLPWRRPGTSPWAVLVSEVMLQQTPVARVQPVWTEWMHRWPQPADLATAGPAAAIRAWGKLGYPRRALRLHAAAVVIAQHYAGAVPADVQTLLALPGIGEYTARAVAAFAFGRRVPVVDANVRRVVARAVAGHADPGPPSTRRDLTYVEALLPNDDATAARFSVALMELGALVCTARSPACGGCPIAERCAWQRAGRPAYDGPRRATQRFGGTDRQVRGLLLDVLRGSPDPVDRTALDVVWPDDGQRERSLASLLADGLAAKRPDGTYALP
ncbi:MAG: A/G-specific adenine glycosylase [Geodermatophilaceae bacterium]|nr:A/G-specific adenine glycosylase [Geodermatophilaceae bacterium]